MTPDPTFTPGPTVSYFMHVRPIFSTYGCLDCHQGLFPQGRYDQSSHQGLMGQGDGAKARNECDVIRGAGSASFLVQKLTGAPGISGQRMPPCCTPTVPAAEVDRLIRWIDQGAPNN